MKKCTRCSKHKPDREFRRRKYYAEERDDPEETPRRIPIWTEISWCRECEAAQKRLKRGRPTVVDVLREAGRVVGRETKAPNPRRRAE